ncbi:SemiSWEET family sugar transporter [Marinobacterium litorale]|jgi:MtN3 and saliva related transmembrane protein|uniref:SemiSWEET family sugar transporter n=1 Tax=Marinobacterium litorale TaxID=404770 RepID=UPI0003FA491F|nr:SemiSWEET transporter [Marinobacterium litorale]
MEATTFVGIFAAICTTSAFVPQVVQILRTGNVDGISLLMYSIFTVGVASWLGYGIIMQDLPMLLANMITLALALSVLGLTLFKRRQNRKIANVVELETATPTEACNNESVLKAA